MQELLTRLVRCRARPVLDAVLRDPGADARSGLSRSLFLLPATMKKALAFPNLHNLSGLSQPDSSTAAHSFRASLALFRVLDSGLLAQLHPGGILTRKCGHPFQATLDFLTF
jgi:hypothetical protein